MRFFTCILCALGLCCAESTSDAQIFRGRGRASCSSGSCANGSCEVPAFARPPSVNVDPLANGVTEQGGAKPEPVPVYVPVPALPSRRADPPLVEQPPIESNPEFPFGVEWDRIVDRKYDDKQGKITLVEALEFAKGSYEDAKKNFRLVVIGTPYERRPVADAYEALPPDMKEKISPWFVTADHWSLRDSETNAAVFETGGKPTVYLLAPDGLTIHRQDGWTSPDDANAIRKGLKKYDPKRDPDLRKMPDPTRVPALGIQRVVKKVMPAALVCGGAFVVLTFLSRRQP